MMLWAAAGQVHCCCAVKKYLEAGPKCNGEQVVHVEGLKFWEGMCPAPYGGLGNALRKFEIASYRYQEQLVRWPEQLLVDRKTVLGPVLKIQGSTVFNIRFENNFWKIVIHLGLPAHLYV